MTEYLKYFMWGYQHHYRDNIQYYAEELFKEISSDLKPQVFLIGILRTDLEGSHPVCIEPEECGIDVDLFLSVDELSESIYNSDPRRNMWHSNPHHHERCVEDLKKECLVKAVKQTVDTNFSDKNVVSFVSYPVILGVYEIFLVLQFDEYQYNKFYSLTKSEVKIHESRSAQVKRSLIEALVDVFLAEAIEPLYKPRPGVYLDDINTDKKELLRIAASNFIDTAIPAASQSKETFELFDICNFISSLKYEGDSSVGKLIICKEAHPNIEVLLKLQKPVKLREYRKVRKLLEISSTDLHLLSNGDYILGFARLKGTYDEKNEDLFIVNFSGSHKWELIHDSNVMMLVEYTNPMLPNPKINKQTFEDLLVRILSNVSEENLSILWNIINVATEQKHGTLIIISNNASEEAERLQHQSINIEPLLLSEELIRNITSIDGAVLLDKRGICHSMGVILDGIATSKGTSSRGARFNSAIRYVEMHKKNCIAVIISEDGMVDLYPQLNPRIKRSDLMDHMAELRNIINKDKVDYDAFRPLMNWFEKHAFYLSKEECEEINSLKNIFNSKLIQEVGAFYIVYQDLKPNEEMNDSYFID